MAAERANSFFEFVEKRERVRLRKEAGLSFPWVEDEILNTYKFTNVRRHHDRTSRILREKFYTPHFNDDMDSILMNCAIARYFGTWEFMEAVGWHDFKSMNDDFWQYLKNLAKTRLEEKERVFTGAYVITNQGISAPKYEVVVDHFLKALQEDCRQITDMATFGSWKGVADIMRRITGFGGSGFMTKEILLDTTYTGFWSNDIREYADDGKMSFPADWNSWTPVGPGARRGAARVMGDDSAKPLKESAAFDTIMDLQFQQDLFLDLDGMFQKEPLSPHDIQFQLCEFDKYERVRLGQGKPRSRYRP